MSMGVLAIVITVVTAVLFASLGILYTWRRTTSVEDYITVRNTVGANVAMATLVASVLGAWILFSPAEAGTFGGVVAVLGYAVGQAAPLLAFAAIGPRMRALMPQGHSLTEYVWVRYGHWMYLATLGTILFYMFIFLSAEMTGIALAVQLVADVPLGLTALVVGIATVTYTAYGGLRASIFTDRIQFGFIAPLLLAGAIVAVVALGGLGTVASQVQEQAPRLLAFGHRVGAEFAVAVIIAILAANMFHQGFWQRVYSCQDVATLRRGFILGGLVIIPVIFVAGLFGILAVAFGLADTPSVALFALVAETLPTWAVMVMLVLALALVMSSMDTLLNGIASVFTSDLAWLKPGLTAAPLLRSSRALTAVVAVPAIYIASQGFSVLYLFLIADLVCAAAVVPVFLGMYTARFNGSMALASLLVGLVGGGLFFPYASLGGPALLGQVFIGLSGEVPGALTPVFQAGSLLYSFAAAVALSTVAAALLHWASTRFQWAPAFGFSRLQEEVRLIQG